MKKAKNRLIAIMLLFLLIYSSFIFYNNVKNGASNSLIQEINSPKLSNNPINITTPLNKSYTEPMSGYYPGTFGFEDVLDDTTPTYCVYDAFGTSPDWVTSYTEVINNKVDGAGNKHNKVLLLKDGSSSSVCLSYLNFTDYGSEIARNCTFEFYYCLNLPGTHYISRIVLLGNFGTLVQIFFDTNALEIKYYNSTGQYSTGLYLDRDMWYRYSIDISCDGGYAGLSANQFRFRIYDANNTLIYTSYDMDFQTSHPTGGPNAFRMASSESQTQVYEYLDAFGITGLQDNYEIGDNLNEGLLLSFENSTALDWIGFSLDGQPNKTILGNTTIPMPEHGMHSIQVFGNTTLGILHESDIRYFAISKKWKYIRKIELSPATPENDYQVRVQLNSSNFNYAKTAPNGSDIRFFDKNNNKLSYWIEKWNISETSLIWVKIPAVNTTFIIMKYGNQFANSESNGTNVFMLFDDFDNNTLDSSKWLYEDDGYSSVTISNGILRVFSDTSNSWATHADLGFHSAYILHGQTFGYKNYTTGATFTPSENIWVTGDFRWINASYAAYYENDMLFSNDSDIIESSNPVRFLTHTTLSGPGTHYGSMVSSVDTSIGTPNRTLRVKAWVDLTGLKSEIKIDWVAVRKGIDYEPSVNICPEIIILELFTPENKTYIEPMSGYYPATYGFENDADGTSPEGWVNQDWVSCTSEIISELGGHNKILRQTDNSNGFGAVVNHTFTSARDYGTAEFYARVSVITSGARLWLDLNSDSGQEIWFTMGDSGIKYWAGGPWYDIIPSGLTANTWYHFSVRWRNTGAPAYEALGEGEWKIFIDGVEYGNYDLVYDDNMTSINLESGAAPSGHITYWDALGFDWDPNYNIGDNLYSGLLLSYENNTSFDWQGYSLDGQPINTIIGNTTIPLPDEGQHKIQVFANDSLGLNYHSGIRYFTVDLVAPVITINLPGLNTLFGIEVPPYDLTIIEINLNSIWYTLDGGSVNTTITEPTGSIALSIWSSRPNGTVLIRFYANDIVRNIGFEDVEVRKDILAPQITINDPIQNQVFYDTPPSFNLSIIEGNLDGIWYTLDDGITNFPCETSGNFNNLYWNAIPPGSYTLKFYANDTLGNLGSSEVIIEKKEPAIPGYNPLLLSLIIVVGIMSISLKTKKKSK